MQYFKLKLNQPQYRQDPWKSFSDLRKRGDVIKIKMPFMGKAWAATTYETVNEVLKNDQLFVRDPVNAGRRTYFPMQWVLPRSFFTLAQNMMGADWQKHRRLRLLVDRAFAMRNIDQMDGQIARLANEQLDIFSAQLRSDGRADLIADFARPFPLTVICELLGLPLADRSKFSEWFAPLSTVSSIWGVFRINSGIKAIVKYLKQQFEDVRQKPRPGLITQLVQAELEGDRLNEDELLSMVFVLLVAGHETTTHLISNLVLTMLQHPQAKDEILANHELIAPAIDETLRYCSPIQVGKPRYVASDTEFGGQQLARGQMITPLLACANYDPARFDHPEKFDIYRDRNYHMTFGSGPHVCLGMKLAKSETTNAIKSLFQRCPELSADFDTSNPNWGKRIGMRNLTNFWVTPG